MRLVLNIYYTYVRTYIKYPYMSECETHAKL